MKQLVTKLPCQGREPEYPISDDTICAIEATLYEVIRNAAEFASYVVSDFLLQPFFSIGIVCFEQVHVLYRFVYYFLFYAISHEIPEFRAISPIP